MRRTLFILSVLSIYCYHAQIVMYEIDEDIVFNITNPGSGQVDFDTIHLNFLQTNLDFVFRFKDYDIGTMGYPEVFTEKLTTVLVNNSTIEVSSSFQGSGGQNGNGIVIESSTPDCPFNSGGWPSLWEVGGSWGFQTNDSIGPNHFNFTGIALLHELIIGYDEFDMTVFGSCNYCYQSYDYLGIRVWVNDQWHYGWVKLDTQFGTHVEQIGINLTPEEGFLAGQIDEYDSPLGLNQSYTQSPQGIYLDWAVFPDAQACQVRGGPIGGNDPHNFIISTAPYNQLFINGNSLTVGEEYQWKVRCATGVNPYSGVSDWSEYDYFIYEP